MHSPLDSAKVDFSNPMANVSNAMSFHFAFVAVVKVGVLFPLRFNVALADNADAGSNVFTPPSWFKQRQITNNSKK